jgi:hypothetical protein
MKSLVTLVVLFVVALLAVSFLAQPAQAIGFSRSVSVQRQVVRQPHRQNVVVRQQVVVQKQVVVQRQQFVAQPVYAQAVVQAVYAQPIVQAQAVCAQPVIQQYRQQVVVPGCQSFFAH